MDTYSYDLVCNPDPDRLLKEFNITTLKCSLAFKKGMADVTKAAATFGRYTDTLDVTPERLSAIDDLSTLHNVNTPQLAALRACTSCGGDSFVPIVAPGCGHVICIRCLLGQKRAQQVIIYPVCKPSELQTFEV